MISYLANPLRFRKFAKYAGPIFGVLAIGLILTGLYFALYNSPEDYQQGHSVRIMYVHVPAAWVSLMAYAIMAVASLTAYIWRHPLADIAAKACALPGLVFTGLALITGSLWGKVSWGTYWQWDGRLTSYLLLFFLYAGYLSIWSIYDDKKKAARIAGLVAMVGSINLPIIKFSVDWWNTLHQPATISSPGAPGAPAEILIPLAIMAAGYTCFFAWLVISEILNDLDSSAKDRKSAPAHKPAQAQLKDL